MPIENYTLSSLRLFMGIVSQENFLFNCSIRENIAYGLTDITEDRIIAAARAAYAHDFIMELPEKYDTIIGERGVKLKEQNFVLVEGGYGFNAFVAVKRGKIVDGLGGTSGFISFSSSGALDAEIVALLKDYPKEMIFRGGLKDFLEREIDSIPRLNWIFEYILKGIKVMEVSIGGDYIVILSGRFFDAYYKEFVEYSGLKCLKIESVKASAEGACIIANGLIGGIYRDVVEHLELKKAKGNVLDYIAENLRNLFKYDI